MGKALDDFAARGRKIAGQLGKGVRYAGPQTVGGVPIYHLFNDDAVTDSAFAGITELDSKANLIVLRMRFGARLPEYAGGIANPVSIAEKLEDDIGKAVSKAFGRS